MDADEKFERKWSWKTSTVPILAWFAFVMSWHVMVTRIAEDPTYLTCGDERIYEMDYKGQTYCVEFAQIAFHYSLYALIFVGVFSGFAFLFVRWVRKKLAERAP